MRRRLMVNNTNNQNIKFHITLNNLDGELSTNPTIYIENIDTGEEYSIKMTNKLTSKEFELPSGEYEFYLINDYGTVKYEINSAFVLVNDKITNINVIDNSGGIFNLTKDMENGILQINTKEKETTSSGGINNRLYISVYILWHDYGYSEERPRLTLNIKNVSGGNDDHSIEIDDNAFELNGLSSGTYQCSVSSSRYEYPEYYINYIDVSGTAISLDVANRFIIQGNESMSYLNVYIE